jgi:hypothetical protein
MAESEAIRELEALLDDEDDLRGAIVERLAELREEDARRERIFNRAGERIMLRAAAMSSRNNIGLELKGQPAISLAPKDLQALVAEGLRWAMEDL